VPALHVDSSSLLTEALTRLTRTAATGELLLRAFLPFLANAAPPQLVSRPEAGLVLSYEREPKIGRRLAHLPGGHFLELSRRMEKSGCNRSIRAVCLFLLAIVQIYAGGKEL
jgi:hypothetical protein